MHEIAKLRLRAKIKRRLVDYNDRNEQWFEQADMLVEDFIFKTGGVCLGEARSMFIRHVARCRNKLWALSCHEQRIKDGTYVSDDLPF